MWPRFSLGRLVVLVAILALLLAWLPLPVAVALTVPTIALVLFAQRFRREHVTLILIFASLALVASATLLSKAHWVGQSRVTLTFLIVDAATKRPIPDALVRIFDPSDFQGADGGRTSSDGRASLRKEFRAVGTEGPFIDTAFVRFSPWWVEVSAPGFQTCVVPLVELTGVICDLHRIPPPPVEVGLLPASSLPEATSVAGSYFLGDGEVGLTLTFDATGGFSLARRYSDGEGGRIQGRVRLFDDRVELTPDSRNNRSGFPFSSIALVPVKWGGRRYLIPKDDHGKFCGAIEAEEEPRNQPHGAFYLRQGDWMASVEEKRERPGPK